MPSLQDVVILLNHPRKYYSRVAAAWIPQNPGLGHNVNFSTLSDNLKLYGTVNCSAAVKQTAVYQDLSPQTFSTSMMGLV